MILQYMTDPKAHMHVAQKLIGKYVLLVDVGVTYPTCIVNKGLQGIEDFRNENKQEYLVFCKHVEFSSKERVQEGIIYHVATCLGSDPNIVSLFV